MSFEPRGKVATLINAMRAAPEKVVWKAGEVATTMGVAQGNLIAYLRACIEHRMIYRKVEDGRSYFSLTPFPDAAPRDPQPLRIPTIAKPGDWVPPVMTPPRGMTGHVPRAPLPEPLHQVLCVAPPAPVAQPEPEPVTLEPDVRDEPECAEIPAAAEAPEFEAALWHDGDLVMYGLEELEDGGYRVPAKNVDSLRWMLGGRAP
jgi:hypothetical protein